MSTPTPERDRPTSEQPAARGTRTMTATRPTTGPTTGGPEQVPPADGQPARPADGRGAVRDGDAVTDGDAVRDWGRLQAQFVDDPAAAVRGASDLVEQAVKQLLHRSGDHDTEGLRAAFLRYRDLHRTLIRS